MNREQQDAAKRAARTAVKRRRACGLCFDPEDVVQDAMVLALELIRDGISDPAVLYNRIRRDLLDDERKIPDADDVASPMTHDPVDPFGSDGFESVDDRDELEVMIRRAGKALTPREVRILTLVYIDGLDLQVAAETLGVKLTTAELYLREASNKIQQFRSEP